VIAHETLHNLTGLNDFLETNKQTGVHPLDLKTFVDSEAAAEALGHFLIDRGWQSVKWGHASSGEFGQRTVRVRVGLRPSEFLEQFNPDRLKVEKANPRPVSK